MKKLFTQLTLCLAVLGAASCQKVSELNDTANIDRIEVVSCDPSKAVFGEPVIKGTEIEVPLVYGKYLFPLNITFGVTTDGGTSQLLGFDKGQELSFADLTQKRKIYTVSASGATTTWTIRIVDAMSNESADVVRAEATAPEGGTALIAPTAAIDKIKSLVTFQGAGAKTYPLTVVPNITLAEGAHFTEELPATLVFEDKNDVMTFTVESASGRTKEWVFMGALVASKDNSDEDDLSNDQVRRLTVPADKIGFNAEGVKMTSSSVRFQASSSIGGQIDILVEPVGGGSLTFPLTAQIIIPTDPQAQLFGAPKDNSYQFSSLTDTKQVWVADRISGMIKCWTLMVSPPMNTDLKSYEITSFTSKDMPTMQVDKDNVEIDNANSRVVIPVASADGTPIDPKAKMSLTINMKLGLNEGATCTTTKTSHTYLTNTGSLSVTTANGLNKRSWTVYLKDKNAAPSSNRTISNMSLVEYSSKDNRMVLYSNSSVADNETRTITFKITANPDAFPLVISKKIIKTNHSAAKVFPTAIADYDTPLVFESLSSVKDFTIQAEDGSTDEWKIVLTTTATGKTADVEGLLVTGASSGVQPVDVILDKTKNHISIVTGGIPPFDFTADIITTDDATVSGIENGVLSFGSYSDIIPLTVTSQDGSLKKTWTVGVERPEKVQINNSDFELWGTYNGVNGGTFTIDPSPGAGYGWGTANLEIFGMGVIGTNPVERADKTKAAEMTTGEQNTILYGYIMAAGTLYTGIFELNLGYITQPRKMTHFGIPYSARPLSFDMDVKYNPGAQLKEATADDKGKYSIHDIAGVDKGHIWIELVRWDGTGVIMYDGNPSEDITVIGRSELVIDGANNPYKEWTKVNLEVRYNDQHAALTPTHIVVVFSSSKDGDKFIGATGSKLGVDSFKINY